MTERERNLMYYLCDMIQGEINRICVSDDFEEIERMKDCVIFNVNRICAIRNGLFNIELPEKEKNG